MKHFKIARAKMHKPISVLILSQGLMAENKLGISKDDSRVNLAC